jgi:hypothetical protein
MGTTSLTVCPGCNRHVRCGERACPFCGASVSSFAQVLEYRINTRLDRYRSLSLGAALTAAGFVTNCTNDPVPMYGAACAPTFCPGFGGNSGATTGGVAHGGAAGTAPTAGATPGGTTLGGSSGSAGTNQQMGGTSSGGGEAGGSSGDSGGEAGGAAGTSEGGAAEGGGASGAGGA